jgi:phosphomannomutase
MAPRPVSIENLMASSNVRFGTSGVRGLASDMTDKVCYAYTAGFIQHLEAAGELIRNSTIALGGDLRTSTPRILRAGVQAVTDRGYRVENCGNLPSPALACYGLIKKIPTIMVTGSHIPDDRNGIKYTKKSGEIMKLDEEAIRTQVISFPEELFDEKDAFMMNLELPPVKNDAIETYKQRYLEFFPENCLKGKNIGAYQHSAVGRELIIEIFTSLGANVTPLGYSESFVPVDTEAIREEDREAALRWSREYRFHSIVSTDGDGDRPLISDERGNWLRGDIAGILCASYLDADAVVMPVSCTTAAEKCGHFETVYRTKIGSPFVVEGMERARRDGARRVVGYEANGGFLLASDIDSKGKKLRALPTRDAILVQIAILLLSIEKKRTIGELVSELPQRFTSSGRLKNFPTERSSEKIAQLCTGDVEKDRKNLEDIFSRYFGPLSHIDITDGLRLTFQNDEVVHLRPSGNAPEFRCYNEADTETRAGEMNKTCLEIMKTWR